MEGMRAAVLWTVRAHRRLGAAVAKPKDAGAGVIEREDIWGRSVAPRLADWAGRPPGRRRVPTCAAAGAHPQGVQGSNGWS